MRDRLVAGHARSARRRARRGRDVCEHSADRLAHQRDDRGDLAGERPNSAAGICCGPSQSASSGAGCTSTMIPSRSDRDRRARERQDEVAPTGRVRGVDDHRQMRLLLQHRDRAEVERVTRRALEGPDPALAEDDAARCLP